MNRPRISLPAAILALGALLASASAWAQVEVKSAWVRGTVGGQRTTAAYMDLTSAQAAALVGAESAAAAIAEVHEMQMDRNIMRMRAVPRLELPAGKTVELKPGGYHVMLMDLKRPLKKGDSVPLKLKIQGPDKKVTTVEVTAEVRDPAAFSAQQHTH